MLSPVQYLMGDEMKKYVSLFGSVVMTAGLISLASGSATPAQAGDGDFCRIKSVSGGYVGERVTTSVWGGNSSDLMARVYCDLYVNGRYVWGGTVYRTSYKTIDISSAVKYGTNNLEFRVSDCPNYLCSNGYKTFSLSYRKYRPDAPTQLVGTAGDEQVSLNWSAPNYNGGASITGYRIGMSSDAGQSWTTVANTSASSRSYLVTGLANDMPYWFVVAAVNSVGVSDYSAPTSSLTPTAPSQVTPAPDSTTGGPDPATPEPSPSSPTTGTPGGEDESAQVIVKSVAKKSRIKIDVNPDGVAGPWKIVVQKRAKQGWKRVKWVAVVKGKRTKVVKAGKLKSRGKKNILVVDPGKGTYRIVVPAAHGYAGTASEPLRVRG
jgi:hypothetical protein